MKFSRQSRLLKPSEFKQVFQRPIRSGDRYFRVLARANGLQRHRLGMAVSKKACAKAVERNRIKRVIRESFRVKVATNNMNTPLDIVVLPTAHAAGQGNKALDASLLTHWQRLTKKASHGNADLRQHRQGH